MNPCKDCVILPICLSTVKKNILYPDNWGIYISFEDLEYRCKLFACAAEHSDSRHEIGKYYIAKLKIESQDFVCLNYSMTTAFCSTK